MIGGNTDAAGILFFILKNVLSFTTRFNGKIVGFFVLKAHICNNRERFIQVIKPIVNYLVVVFKPLYLEVVHNLRTRVGVVGVVGVDLCVICSYFNFCRVCKSVNYRGSSKMCD